MLYQIIGAHLRAFNHVIPAQAGTRPGEMFETDKWVPAFAGTTIPYSPLPRGDAFVDDLEAVAVAAGVGFALALLVDDFRLCL